MSSPFALNSFAEQHYSRPNPALVLFSNAHRDEFKSKHPELSGSEITRELVRQWHESKEQDFWRDLATNLSVKHKEMAEKDTRRIAKIRRLCERLKKQCDKLTNSHLIQASEYSKPFQRFNSFRLYRMPDMIFGLENEHEMEVFSSKIHTDPTHVEEHSMFRFFINMTRQYDLPQSMVFTLKQVQKHAELLE